MKLTCDTCSTRLKVDNVNAGDVITCPKCDGSIVIPEAIENEREPVPETPAGIVKEMYEADIDQGMTISRYMSQRGIEGGRELTSDTTSSSASALIESEKGKKYAVGKMMARGGMGGILRARDMNIRRQIAMKVMLQSNKASNDDVLRFIEEAQVTGQLEHPNITPVHELGVDASGNVFFTMKMIKGRTLKDILHDIRVGRPETVDAFPLNRLLNTFMKVCDAIGYAHNKGVIHRDLKPENIMVGEFGEVLVIDWGIAKILGREEEVPKASTPRKVKKGKLPEWVVEEIDSSRQDDASQRTMAGTVIGTPDFMAPEQAYGHVDQIDRRTDIYALGAILYNILTLRKPIDGDSVYQILLKVINGEIVDPTSIRSARKLSGRELLKTNVTVLRHCPGGQVPPSLAAVAMKALRIEQNERYQSVNELQADIEAYQSGFATGAEDAGLIRQLKLLVGRHKREFGLAVAGLVLLAIAAAVAFWRVNEERKVAKQNAKRAEENAALAGERADEATKARNESEKSLAIAQRSNYVSLIALSQANIDDARYGNARSLLAECPEQFRNYEWNRLNLLCDIGSEVFKGHQMGLDSVAFSRNGKQILTAGKDGTAKLWDTRTGHVVMTFADPKKARVMTAAFSPDGRKVLTRNFDSVVRLWDASSGKELFALEEGRFLSSIFTPDGGHILTIGSDGTPRLWSAATGKQTRMLKGRTIGVPSLTTMTFSPDGKHFLVGQGKAAVLWNFETGRVARTINTPCSSVAFSPNGKEILTGWGDAIMLWDAQSGKFLRRFAGVGYVFTVAFSPNSKQILTSGETEAALWDVASGKKLHTFKGPMDRCSAAFSPNGKHVLTGGEDCAVLWDVASGQKVCSYDGWLKGKERERLEERQVLELKGHKRWILSADISPDGKKVATGAGDRAVKVWDAHDGRLLRTISTKAGYGGAYAWCVAFSPDSRHVLSPYGDGFAIWEVSSGKMRKAFGGDKHSQIRSGAFTPDGSRCVCGSDRGEIKLWDVTSGARIRTYMGHKEGVRSIAFSPDGKRLLSGSRDGSARVWDVESGQTLLTLMPGDKVLSVAFSPDGKQLLTGGVLGAKLWNTLDGREIAELKGHDAQVTALTFSPDGKRILTGSADRTAKLWDVTSGKELISLKGHTAGVTAVAISPDGKRIITASGDYTAMIWKSE